MRASVVAAEIEGKQGELRVPQTCFVANAEQEPLQQQGQTPRQIYHQGLTRRYRLRVLKLLA